MLHIMRCPKDEIVIREAGSVTITKYLLGGLQHGESNGSDCVHLAPNEDRGNKDLAELGSESSITAIEISSTSA